MRAFVFTDASLARYAGRFVWLSIDIDNATNAAFVEKYRVHAVPTCLVVDPKTESISARFYGGLTVASLERMLDENAKKKPADALVRADRLAMEGKTADAAKMYNDALKQLPRKSAKYGRAADSYIVALASTQQ